MTKEGTVKLSDFGLSRVIQNGAQSNKMGSEKYSEDDKVCVREHEYEEESRDAGIQERVALTLRVGTRQWMSPEMLQRRAYTRKTDVYSVTVVMWEILTGGIPFDDVNRDSIQALVSAGDRPPIPACCPLRISQILQLGWHDDPEKRPTAGVLVQLLQDALEEVQNTPLYLLPTAQQMSLKAMRAQALAKMQQSQQTQGTQGLAHNVKSNY